MSAALQSRKDDRRDTILNVARECFLAEGYGATSMSTIAARLGGSKGTLYNYFRSKEELFDAFVRRSCGEMSVGLFQAPADGVDTRTRLVRQARAFLDLLLSPDAIALQRVIIGEGARFPELGRAFYDAGPTLVLGKLAEEMRELMDAGELRRADPRLAAHQFKDLAVSGVYQLRLWGVVDDPAPGDLQQRAETAVDTFLRAYAPR